MVPLSEGSNVMVSAPALSFAARTASRYVQLSAVRSVQRVGSAVMSESESTMKVAPVAPAGALPMAVLKTMPPPTVPRRSELPAATRAVFPMP